MKTPTAIPILLCLLTLTACQSGQAPEQERQNELFFADLYVRYIAPQQQYMASASFLQGDSLQTAETILLDGPVRFQSKEMKARQLPQGVIRYRTEMKEAYQNSNTFVFNAPGGKETGLELTLPPVDSFEVVGGTASLSKGMGLLLHGAPLQDGERLVLLFMDETQKGESITLPGPQFGDTIKLHPLRLRKLSPGPHSLYLVRKVSQDTQLAGVQLRSAAEFYSDSLPFDVVE